MIATGLLPPTPAVSACAFAAVSAAVVWCLRVERPSGRRALGLARDVLALSTIGAMFALAAPTTLRWKPVEWAARIVQEEKATRASALAQQAAAHRILVLEDRIAAIASGSIGPRPGEALPPQRDGPFPWRDMTAAEAEQLHGTARDAYDQVKDVRRFPGKVASALEHHCQYRLWRADGGDESRPVAVITLLPGLLSLHAPWSHYEGAAMARDGTKLTLSPRGRFLGEEDRSQLALVQSLFFEPGPTLIHAIAKDLAEDRDVVIGLKSVQRGPTPVVRLATNYTATPELQGRLRCTTSPPTGLAEVAVLQRWLEAAATR